MEVLRLENLSKYYTSQAGVVMALSSVNLSFSVGEFVAITGESGSGKSTLAHVLGGMLPYESGELYIHGRPTSHYDAADWECHRRDNIGFISQNYGILEGNTVLQNVEVALRLGGIDKHEAATRAEHLLRQVDLYEMRTRRAGKLSSGQKQRLAIARALAKPSRILIADEPTGNLDRENSDKIISLLKQASRDRLVILITHEFDEAKDVATRRIELADGIVVSDAALDNPRQPVSPSPAAAPSHKKSKKPKLSGYVARLTLAARPIFSLIVCLLLAVTSFITFAVLGTFTVALDDTNTKIYTSDAFANGTPERIVVMKPGRQAFTAQDFTTLLGMDYIQSIEQRGYACDVNYYYRPGVDHQSYTDIVNGPNYHPLLNPDDIYVKETVKFLSDHPLFVRTLPLTTEPILTAGREAQGAYEVVSADPAYAVGDTVKIYLHNEKDWSITSYICLQFTVVGQTSEGEGFYFSDTLAATLSYASSSVPDESGNMLQNASVILLPYQPDQFVIDKEFVEVFADENLVEPQYSAMAATDGKIELAENGMIVSNSFFTGRKMRAGRSYALTSGEDVAFYQAKGTFNATNSLMVLVHPDAYEALVNRTPDTQISLFIQDYAYADRVMDALSDAGYLAVSPFRLGATKTNATLAAERNTTLSICLAAFALILVLQTLVLRAMFSSIHGHLRLLSGIGMTAKSAYGALFCMLPLYTLLGEGLGAGLIALLNSLGVARIVNIFKYLEADVIALLFLAHLLSVVLAFGIVLWSIRRAVFAKAHKATDLELLQEED